MCSLRRKRGSLRSLEGPEDLTSLHSGGHKTICGEKKPHSQTMVDQKWVNDLELFFNRLDETPVPPPAQSHLLPPFLHLHPFYCSILTLSLFPQNLLRPYRKPSTLWNSPITYTTASITICRRSLTTHRGWGWQIPQKRTLLTSVKGTASRSRQDVQRASSGFL